MGILFFEKPKKARSTEEHHDMYSSDSGVPGTYVPNMSDEDKKKWKAKHIKGQQERVEIRKTFTDFGHYSQVLIKVFPDGVEISMNGKTGMSNQDYADLLLAIEEARSLFNQN